MQDSISASNLPNPSFKPSFSSSKPPPNHSLLKVSQFPTEGFLPFSENSKKVLSRVFSQERLESRQNERIASNLTSSSSKKRLILKNRQKFPSDFFQDSNSKINPELLEKRLTHHADSLIPSIPSPQMGQEFFPNPDMLDFIHADQGNIHETPKFSCDNSPIQIYEPGYAQDPRLNPFEVQKDRIGTAHHLTNSIDNIKKLEFNRIYSALLPNTRKLGSLTERVLNEGPTPVMARKDTLQPGKRAHNDAGLSALLNESVSRVSSQESLYRPIMFDNNIHTRLYNESKERDAHIATAESKNRVRRNKQLEEMIALRRRSSEIISKGSQSALPQIRNVFENSETSISLLKAKPEGFMGPNVSYIRKEDRGVKAFDYRLKLTENSTLGSRAGSENSPLLYADKFRPAEDFSNLVLEPSRKAGYEVIMHSARKLSAGADPNTEDMILNQTDLEEKSGTALRRYTSVEGKLGAALLNMNDLQRKLNGRSEGGARNKAKIILHRRHASMQLDHSVLLKYEQKKSIEDPGEKVRHPSASAQKQVTRPVGQINNFIKESPYGLKVRGKAEKVLGDKQNKSHQSRSVNSSRPDTMEIKSRINSRGPAKKDYYSAVSGASSSSDITQKDPNKNALKAQEKNYNSQVPQKVEEKHEENNQNVANKVGTRQRGFTFGKDNKEDEKNKTKEQGVVILEDRKESETSYRMETREDSIGRESQDLMKVFKD